MSNDSNPNYYRLGVFVLAGIAVLIAVILIFGGGKLFQRSFMVETYLKQSVTGLDTGAAVRFRGVKIGQVTMIGLSGDMYEKDVPFNERRQYVVVRMQIFGEKVNEEQIREFVENNLRARIKSMGITGVNYVEFDFVSSAHNFPQLPYAWKSEYPVIPSLPNQVDEIMTGIQKLVSAINDMNLDGAQKKLDKVFDNLNTLMAGDGKGNEGLTKSVHELNLILTRVAKVTDKDELNILMRELVAATTALRQTITSVQGDTALTMDNIKQAGENINEFSRIMSQSPSSLIWSEPPPKITPPNNQPGQSGAQK
jgi:phospholipid/cholesterol/gamma-HCH transport system substrate-binding protein/paraquat-inducible protein B